MTSAGALLLLTATAGTPAEVEQIYAFFDVLVDTNKAFAEGAERRADAAKARPAFARAARGYDELWHRGFRNPALALNRARAHRQAGDLAGAGAAFHERPPVPPY